MRFDRSPRPRGLRPHTPQRIAAATRALQQARDRVPLFADQLVTETVSERLERQDAAALLAYQYLRDVRARKWREARRRLAALTPEVRHTILQEWKTHRWMSGSPEYLLDLLHRRTQPLPAAYPLSAGDEPSVPPLGGCPARRRG